jgi:hypothetical protein
MASNSGSVSLRDFAPSSTMLPGNSTAIPSISRPLPYRYPLFISVYAFSRMLSVAETM